MLSFVFLLLLLNVYKQEMSENTQIFLTLFFSLPLEVNCCPYKLLNAKEQPFGERGVSAIAFLFIYVKEVRKCISFYKKPKSLKTL